MSGFSSITFPEEVYRWLISLNVIENKGMGFVNVKGS